MQNEVNVKNQRGDLLNIQGLVEIKLPLITSESINIGRYTINYSSYTKAGSGKPMSENEDYVLIEKFNSLNEESFIVVMVLDGLTGCLQGREKEELLKKYNGQTGGKVAAKVIANELLTSLKNKQSICEDSIKQSILEANSKLDLLNKKENLMNPSFKFATMLSLGIISEKGDVFISQVGDSQIYAPQDKILWSGDQDETGIIEKWILDKSPNKDKWDFFIKRRELINNPDKNYVVSVMNQLLSEYEYPKDKVPSGEDLIYSALNGDPRVTDFIKIAKLKVSDKKKTIAFYTDGIIDGIANLQLFCGTITSNEPKQALDKISKRIVETINSNQNDGTKRWGDDEGIVVIEIDPC